MTAVDRDQFVARVEANVALCREHYRLVLKVDAFPATRPGQFVQASCRDLDVDYSPQREFEWDPAHPLLDVAGRELMSPLAFLRRPFSLAGRRDVAGGVELDVIHRVVGVGTDWMAHLTPGDKVHILGPLGNCFDLPSADEQAILVGGGVGIPPMLYLAAALRDRGVSASAVAFCGALTRDLLPLEIDPAAPVPTADAADPLPIIREFSRCGIASVISTDDGSYGFRGYVTQALERYLDRRGQGSGVRGQNGVLLTPDSRPLTPVIYTCGPEPMMKRVAEIAATRGIECQIAVERAMACGMGTCQSCVIRVRKADPGKPPLAGKDWCFRLACTDGPVFRGSDLMW